MSRTAKNRNRLTTFFFQTLATCILKTIEADPLAHTDSHCHTLAHSKQSASEAHTKTTLPTPGEAKIGVPDEHHETTGTPANPTRTASDTNTHANTRRASERCADVRGRAGAGLNARASEAHTKTTLPTPGEAKTEVPGAAGVTAGTPANPTRTTSDTNTHANTRSASGTVLDFLDEQSA